MECQSCNSVAPLFDQGTVELQENGFAGTTFRYDSKEQLIDYLYSLEQFEHPAAAETPMIRITGQSGLYVSEPPFMPLRQYMDRLRHRHTFEIIRQKSFTSHLQPIVSAENGAPVAYEFLLRPIPGGPEFKPYELFEFARTAGLHSFLDRQARITAIETGARLLPSGIKRFINFLPSSIYNPDYCLSHTFHAIETNRQDPADFVFEVVETERVDDIDHLKKVFRAYQREGVKVALDDVGSGYSTVGMMQDLRPDFIKIDRAIIDGCDTDENKQRTIRSIVELAADFGGTVLAEGLERAEEWAFCRSAGVGLGQGYLLGRPAPNPVA